MISTILFDLDGTILDTNELIIASFMHALYEHQLTPVTREQIISQMGGSLKEQIALFSGKTDAEDIVQSYRTFNLLKHDEMVQVFPHVQEVMSALHAQGIQMGIVTSKIRLTTLQGLKLFGLEPYLSTVVTLDDVVKHKPHPESVLLALSQLKADPKTALMVGDSQYDLLSAQDAGVRSAGVAWSLKGESFLRTFNPTYIIQDMRDLLKIVAADAVASVHSDVVVNSEG
jgi:pyrophosphatase PpaX